MTHNERQKDIALDSMSQKDLKKNILRDNIAFQLTRFEMSVPTTGSSAGLINADSFADAVIETCGPYFRKEVADLMKEMIEALRPTVSKAFLDRYEALLMDITNAS
jgi:hypothetical protein